MKISARRPFLPGRWETALNVMNYRRRVLSVALLAGIISRQWQEGQ
jgi:hypothetical protein